MKKWFAGLTLIVLSVSLISAPVAGSTKLELSYGDEVQRKLTVHSDSMIIINRGERVEFSGSVTVSDKVATFQGEAVTVHLDSERKRVLTLEALQGAKFTWPNGEASADSLIYDVSKEEVVLEKNVSVNSDLGVFTTYALVYNLKSGNAHTLTEQEFLNRSSP